MFLALLLSTYLALYQNPAIASNQTPSVLLDVSQCESGQRQFDASGNVLRGITGDIGYFQISPRWIPTAQSLGYDIYTEQGNIDFGLWLFNKYGLEPWNSSKHCWQKLTPQDT